MKTHVISCIHFSKVVSGRGFSCIRNHVQIQPTVKGKNLGPRGTFFLFEIILLKLKIVNQFIQEKLPMNVCPFILNTFSEQLKRKPW